MPWMATLELVEKFQAHLIKIVDQGIRKSCEARQIHQIIETKHDLLHALSGVDRETPLVSLFAHGRPPAQTGMRSRRKFGVSIDAAEQ
jgi:hypothetical protein